jgi:hypothetical protein
MGRDIRTIDVYSADGLYGAQIESQQDRFETETSQKQDEKQDETKRVITVRQYF